MSNHITRQLFTRAGHYPGSTTRASDLSSLIESMRITSTEQGLIRLGPDADGGYLLPDDLDGINYCFSPGVADCSGFELDLANRDMKIFLADYSVDAPPDMDPRFHFIKKFIASTTAPEKGLITLDEWYRQELEPASDQSPEAVLQMDIEGCEYEVLHNISDTLLQRFRIVVIEFHKLHQLVDRFSFGWMNAAICKLLKTHAVVHIHPNNGRSTLKYAGMEIPSIMEVTFLRRDRIRPTGSPPVFPNPMDRKCVASRPELVLPKCWYQP